MLREWAALWCVSESGAVSPGICDRGGVTGYTMAGIKFWDCVFDVLQVVAAWKRSCGWKSMRRLRQLTSGVARVPWNTL